MSKIIEVSTADTFKGSAKKVLDAAKAQGWEVKVEHELTEVTRSIVATKITATWPGAPVEGQYVKIATTHNPESGGFYSVSCDVLSNKGNVQAMYRSREWKLKDTINALGHGPVAYAIAIANRTKAQAEAAAKQAAERAALDQAGEIEAIKKLVTKTKQARNEAAYELRQNLQAIISRAQEAIDTLDTGVPPRSFGGGVLGNQVVAAADQAAAKLLVLSDQFDHLEWMFPGPVDDVWKNWPAADERKARIKAAASA